jgi:hypothetical protein
MILSAYQATIKNVDDELKGIAGRRHITPTRRRVLAGGGEAVLFFFMCQCEKHNQR